MRASWGDRGGQEASGSCGPGRRSVAIGSRRGEGHLPWAMMKVDCLQQSAPSTGYAMLYLCPTTPGDSLRYDKAGHRQLALAMIRQRLGPYGGGGLMRPQVRFAVFRPATRLMGGETSSRRTRRDSGLVRTRSPRCDAGQISDERYKCKSAQVSTNKGTGRRVAVSSQVQLEA